MRYIVGWVKEGNLVCWAWAVPSLDKSFTWQGIGPHGDTEKSFLKLLRFAKMLWCTKYTSIQNKKQKFAYVDSPQSSYPSVSTLSIGVYAFSTMCVFVVIHPFFKITFTHTVLQFTFFTQPICYLHLSCKLTQTSFIYLDSCIDFSNREIHNYLPITCLIYHQFFLITKIL